MKRRLLRWLIGGEDVYVAIYSPDADVVVFDVHTDFDGATENMAGYGTVWRVHTLTMVID